MNWDALLGELDMDTLVKIIEDCERRKRSNPEDISYVGRMNLMIEKCKEQMKKRGALVV